MIFEIINKGDLKVVTYLLGHPVCATIYTILIFYFDIILLLI